MPDSGTFSNRPKDSARTNSRRSPIRRPTRDSGLDLAVDFTSFGNPVLQWGGGDDDWRTWSLVSLGDGSCRIEIARTRQALDANPTPGNGCPDVVAYDWWGGANQRWLFDLKDTLYP